ncbi:hypothetical protein CBM2585_A130135 [Cupriavidus taiwanensis]|nr:hypothetical protein CBM2585_A130135 [Cupriavidus taiwanensis]
MRPASQGSLARRRMGGTDEGTRNSEGEESWRHLTLPQSCRLRERRRYCTKAGAVVKVQ